MVINNVCTIRTAQESNKFLAVIFQVSIIVPENLKQDVSAMMTEQKERNGQILASSGLIL